MIRLPKYIQLVCNEQTQLYARQMNIFWNINGVLWHREIVEVETRLHVIYFLYIYIFCHSPAFSELNVVNEVVHSNNQCELCKLFTFHTIFSTQNPNYILAFF